ncbi:MAG: tRNA preQ1(34) S-adenosylmethionine ribosyltransferase-isomerase QueA [Chitinophagia bacterium]|nr:tRNA preQ1(34) S-adenosylmethionine ribosyltransferase-isomerase QueA [Chitinophagia bacterium]
MGQASKGLKPGTRLEFAGGLTAEILAALEGGEVQARFRWTPSRSLHALLGEVGRLPLPPYISREPTADDTERYQTVFAQSPGSVAAPTAGLHFTPRVLEALSTRGIERVSVTLDVGPGTFLPVRDDDIESHRMHEERYFIPDATAERIRLAKREGRRVVAVGTTVVRTLESAATRDERLLCSGVSSSALFIKPGFSFQLVDALITNFHLPRSTLLMLVSAFLGREHALNAYAEAVKQGYRFFSYGDAMLIGDFDVEG